jgi:hypothetical protein
MTGLRNIEVPPNLDRAAFAVPFMGQDNIGEWTP